MNPESEILNQTGSETTPLSPNESQLDRLKTKINELKEDILNAGVELSEAPSGPSRTAAQKKLKDLNETHAALALALSNITEVEQPKGPSQNAIAQSAHRYFKQCVPFQEKDQPDEFWLYFEGICQNNGLEMPVARLLLSHLIAKYPNGAQWYASHVVPSTTETLEDLKQLFEVQFVTEGSRNEHPRRRTDFVT